MIEFISTVDDEKTEYKSSYTIVDQAYFFEDKTLNNCFISVKVINNTHVEIKRSGDIISTMDFILNKTTKNPYSFKSVSMEFTFLTTKIEITKDKILIKYKVLETFSGYSSASLLLIIH